MYRSLFFASIIISLSFSCQNEAQRKTKPRVFSLQSEMTPIKDQGTRNSCGLFAAIALIEYDFKKRFGKEVNLSEEYLTYNIKTSLGHKTEITSLLDAANSIIKEGLIHEEQWPYRISYFDKGYPCDQYEYDDTNAPKFCYAHNLPRHKNWKETIKGFSAKDFRITPTSDHNLLTDILYKMKCPIAICFPLTDDNSNWHQNNDGNVFFNSSLYAQDTNHGYHIAVICGYDLDKKVYFVRNSWGEDWGYKGYGTISFKDINDWTGDGIYFNPKKPENIVIPELNPKKPFKIQKLEATTKLNSDKSLDLKIKSQIDNLGLHNIEIRSIFKIISKDGKEEEITLTENEQKRLGDQYARKVWVYIPDGFYSDPLVWGENNPVILNFPKEMTSCYNLQKALKDENKKIILQTSLYLISDRSGYKIYKRVLTPIDKNQLIKLS